MLDIHDPALARYMTPYKYGKPVLEGSGIEGRFDSRAVDIPFVFFHRGRFFMLYTGFDGIGYQSAFAVSDDLLHWEFYGMVLPRLSPGDTKRWDAVSASASWILRDNELFGGGGLKKYDGKYWMVYSSYPGAGYEQGPAEISLAWTDREDLSGWRRLEKPVYSWRDGADWEKGGLYKTCLVQTEDRFYLFYNAKNTEKPWIEQTGVAFSGDMLHWDRYGGNPVLRVVPNSWQQRFVSEPCVFRDGDTWVNFYFGNGPGHAQDGIAISKDLLHWELGAEPVIPHGEEGDIDQVHSHKASMIYHGGVLYHFYCAVRRWREGDRTSSVLAKDWNEYRCITVACSKPFHA